MIYIITLNNLIGLFVIGIDFTSQHEANLSDLYIYNRLGDCVQRCYVKSIRMLIPCFTV